MHFLCRINTGRTERGIRQKAQRGRMRCCRLGREEENVSVERESGVGFKSRLTLVDFDQWSKSTQSIFGYRKYPYEHIYFETV